MRSVSEYYSLVGKPVSILLKDISHPIKLKFIGFLQGRDGLYCGFDLLERNKGKNSGAVDGIVYFETEAEMSGLFIPFYKVEAEIESALTEYRALERAKTAANNNISDEENSAQIMEKEYLLKIIDNQNVLIEEFSKLVSEIDPTISTWEVEMVRLQQEIQQLKSENESLKQGLDFDLNDEENIDKILNTPFKMKKNVTQMTPIALSKSYLVRGSSGGKSGAEMGDLSVRPGQNDEYL